jgi:AcrR family transcriptional regulator
LTLFAEQGFDRTTTRDIGAAAKVTSPALYRHYASKWELGVDLYRRCYSLMVTAVRWAVGGYDCPLEKLCSYPAGLSALYERDPLAVLFVDEHQLRFWPHLRAEFEPDTLSSFVAEWVAAGREAGVVSNGVHVEAQAALVMGLTSQWFAMRHAGLASKESAQSLPQVVRAALKPSLERTS